MKNAQIKHTIEKKTNVDASFAVPAAVIAAAAGVPLPIPLDSDVDVGAGVGVQRGAGEDASYGVVEELVYAVQYRKIHFEWFSSGKVDKSYLEKGEKGGRWISYVGDRSDETGEKMDAIDVEVIDPVKIGDFEGAFESFDLDGEEILYEVKEEEVTKGSWSESRQHSSERLSNWLNYIQNIRLLPVCGSYTHNIVSKAYLCVNRSSVTYETISIC